MKTRGFGRDGEQEATLLAKCVLQDIKQSIADVDAFVFASLLVAFGPEVLRHLSSKDRQSLPAGAARDPVRLTLHCGGRQHVP
jgi:hypothetical protein